MRRDRLPAHGVLAGQARAGEAPDTAPGGGTLADHAIDDAAAVELLTRAVSCPSPSGREEEVARLLVAAMSAGGAEACLDDAGNAVGVWGGGPVSVTFLGHMDTAPGTFPVRVSDGVLHGRGSVDAKGSLCAAVVAASRLSAELLDRLTLRVVGAVEEESSGSRGCRHALTTLPRPDFLIVGEPSGWDRYTLGYKGRVSARLEASRDSAHTAREDPSAAELLVDAYTALRGWVERDNLGADGAFDRLQVTLRGLVSEDDGLVERSRGEVAFRLPPRWSAAGLSARLGQLRLDRGVRLTVTSAEEPVRADNASPLARAFRVAIRSCGGVPRPVVKTGTSDMNVAAASWSVPMLAYGPGDSELDHTPHERLALGEYLRAIAVLGRAVSELV
ncbi:MAG TPA: [LysW]-lysine hydrolase [Trueperaceae bacterium]|mgnify:CR=1 FL=1|nr:[LysW]-lysine hydrolase [Trueperaceae bacterium]